MIAESTRSPVARLTELRHFMGPSRELWPPLAEGLGSLAGADRCLLALGTRPAPTPAAPGTSGAPADGDATDYESLQWGRLHDWTRGPVEGPANGLLNGQLVSVAAAAGRQGTLVRGLSVAGAFVVAMRLPVLSPTEVCIAIFLLTQADEAAARNALERVLLAQDTVRLAQEYRQARDGAASQIRLGETLEALAVVQDQSRFFAAA
ncbi:MAG: hypothetical protein JNL97_04560, partial [Verrucomicrobiales bacterium]|nr:hypothetical protein [Verrucomicrobiales bacterium]